MRAAVGALIPHRNPTSPVPVVIALFSLTKVQLGQRSFHTRHAAAIVGFGLGGNFAFPGQ